MGFFSMFSSTPTSTSSQPLENILILRPIPDHSLAALKSTLTNVYYHPDPTLPTSISAITPELLSTIDITLTDYRGLPPAIIPSFHLTPRLKIAQHCSAGTERVIATSAVQEMLEELKSGKRKEGDVVKVINASGVHVVSIAPWCVEKTIALLQQSNKMVIRSHEAKDWYKDKDVGGPLGEEVYYARSLRGLTVGILGYGALGRETARLLKPFLVNIIAANSAGKPTRDEGGYIIPGTGDLRGTIPSTYYSTRDTSSFNDFLSKSDVLICTLPSTPSTRGLLTRGKFALLPKGAIVLNVGRGDLFDSDDLLHALSQNLSGAALDVTNPEPLPANHPLWSHPNVIITPHLSGHAEDEYGLAVELLIENVGRWRKGEGLVNVVDLEKGY